MTAPRRAARVRGRESQWRQHVRDRPLGRLARPRALRRGRRGRAELPLALRAADRAALPRLHGRRLDGGARPAATAAATLRAAALLRARPLDRLPAARPRRLGARPRRSSPGSARWRIVGRARSIVLFGLHFLGVLRLPFLAARRASRRAAETGTALGAYVFGLAFAFGWTPCIGPVLGAILSLAAQGGSAGRGLLLMGAYALGLGVPFLLTALFLGRALGLMAGLKRHMAAVERAIGVAPGRRRPADADRRLQRASPSGCSTPSRPSPASARAGWFIRIPADRFAGCERVGLCDDCRGTACACLGWRTLPYAVPRGRRLVPKTPPEFYKVANHLSRLTGFQPRKASLFRDCLALAAPRFSRRSRRPTAAGAWTKAVGMRQRARARYRPPVRGTRPARAPGSPRRGRARRRAPRRSRRRGR